MERTCNSCKNHNTCRECIVMTEEKRDVLSCTKYSPMQLYEYIGRQQEKTRSLLIPLDGVENYFIN